MERDAYPAKQDSAFEKEKCEKNAFFCKRYNISVTFCE